MPSSVGWLVRPDGTPSLSRSLQVGVSNRMVMPNRLNRFSLEPIIDSNPIGTYTYN